MARRKKPAGDKDVGPLMGYDQVLSDLVGLLEDARRAAARSVNALMTATYWLVGRRIVEGEQQGAARARYGEALIEKLSQDLGRRFGRGFSMRNLEQMRRFYLAWPIPQTASAESKSLLGATNPQTASAISGSGKGRVPAAAVTPSNMEKVQTASALLPRDLPTIAAHLPLPWSHYVKLLSVEKAEARTFYEAEAIRGGWNVRQLGRQISSQFYERTLLSKNKAAMLRKGSTPRPGDAVSPEEEIKDPLVLEFLGLKDEYSESELEEALITKLESFLLELGDGFTFVGRQRRLRIGDEWYRIDLLFFHRRLRCLVVIDLKLGKFTHADAGQMHLYLNYAREHWTLPEENPPVGVILCAQKDEAVVHYALEGLPNKVLAAEYRMALPDEKLLAEELQRTRLLLEHRGK